MDKQTQITEQNIQTLVHRFYAKVRQDVALGPIFAKAIGSDDKGWQPHLAKMCCFWSAMMLRTGTYQGTPFQKHMALPPFDLQLFDRWLALFAETAHGIYVANVADLFVLKSRIIAESLKAGLTLRRKPAS